MMRLGATRVDLAACGSTNDEAARLARDGCSDGTIVVAAAQHAGRGRLGRSWSSPPGGAYFSVVVRPDGPVAEQAGVTLAVGIAVCDALRALGAAAALKWPNDVVVAGPAGVAKLAGVLAETTSAGGKIDALVIGVGVNVAPVVVDGAAATSLAALGVTTSVDDVIAAVLRELEAWLARFAGGGVAAVRDAWLARAATGVVVRARSGERDVEGTCAGIDRDGALLVRERDGAVVRVVAGDVAVVTPDLVSVNDGGVAPSMER